MIRSLLIANRGEIAVRIAATARRMGIRTVGIYSPADRDALHVRSVNTAYALRGSTPAESYLDAQNIIAIALDDGCDAIHPGYGFLAERADVAQMAIDAGLAWVGPRPEQIEQLGDKISAKQAAIEADVPTQPFFLVDDGAVPDGVTFPAIVKAAAGGGGRGMRVVSGEDELPAALADASREAEAAFGDGTVFIEPYLADGRHIEVQIIGDRHGNVVHLGERDCSVQRRNQKVVEESPAPGLSDELRARLCDGAVALARHVGYENAGTVEYMVGDDGAVTFLEVNTRLQVEHPVTEQVTGLDLVEMQLRVAAGEPLGIAQSEIAHDGHAIEARIVAESPRTGWMPSLGSIEAFAIPATCRVDTGVTAGSEVSVHYDSLLTKITAHGPTRDAARATLIDTLRRTVIVGVETNLDALVGILDHDDFRSGAHRTSLLAQHPELAEFSPVAGPDRSAHLAALIDATTHADRAADSLTGWAPAGWRNLRTQGQRDEWVSSDEIIETEAIGAPDGWTIQIGSWPRPTDDGTLAADTRDCVDARLRRHDDTWSVEIDGRIQQITVVAHGEVWCTTGPTGTRQWQRAERFTVPDDAGSGAGPVSPLPGTVLELHVDAGAQVQAGQLLAVVEAMKMEHRIVADTDARVTEVLVAVGDRVDAGSRLVDLSELDD